MGWESLFCRRCVSTEECICIVVYWYCGGGRVVDNCHDDNGDFHDNSCKKTKKWIMTRYHDGGSRGDVPPGV